MRNILEKAGVTNVSLQCGDCLRLNTDDELHSKVIFLQMFFNYSVEKTFCSKVPEVYERVLRS